MIRLAVIPVECDAAGISTQPERRRLVLVNYIWRKIIKKHIVVMAVGFLWAVNLLAGAVRDYNVVWDSPSKDYNGSMPLGNGDITLNAWVEPGGDLLFYIGKTDSWGDNARLLKVGRVRVHLEPSLVQPGGTFRQELDLSTGSIRVNSEANGKRTELTLWVDANNPAIKIAVDSDAPTVATATIELWRTKPQVLPAKNSDVLVGLPKDKQRTLVEPDTVLKNLKGQIGWYHHNVKSVGPKETAEVQGMTGYPRKDPLLNRTFGGVITATGGVRLDDTHLKSAKAKHHQISVYVLTRHPSSPDEWLAAIESLIRNLEKASFQTMRHQHEVWWQEFWDRSWIDIRQAESGSAQTSPQNNIPVKMAVDKVGKNKLVGDNRNKKTADHVSPASDTPAYVVARGYALQRFITACAGRGHYPIKFNGSLFTVPAAGKPGDADYRRWGPGYWWQNTRHPYLGLCASGDFEMIDPLFRMYVDVILPLNIYRTKHYFGYDNAAYYIECVYFWGDVFSSSYGWQPMSQRSDPLQQSGWHKHEWVAGPELVWMMLDAYDYTQNNAMLKKRIIPTATAVMRFFDNYYKTSADGKLVMNPAQAVETWWDCTNPMPEVAGLRAITTRLLALPKSSVPQKDRRYWKAFMAKIPELPTCQRDGVRMWAPAKKFANKRNCENPELYCVFPFRLCSFENDNCELGLQALKHRWDRGFFGWRQDDLFMAYLGLPEQTRQALVKRASVHYKLSRFPAFWGPNYDWVPDQDHGGVLMRGVQAMLLQADPYSRKIYLMPAWPKDWDCDFKLHAPYNTTVQGQIKNGKVVALRVTPQSRRKDLVIKH